MFSGNPALLVTDNTLQEYLVDKTTGLPLAAGTVTTYEDTSRLVKKAVYYQTGTPGAYTYTALPNPIVLSASGTVTDPDGNDTKIFYYPYDSDLVSPNAEAYYVVVEDEDGTQQFIRENFPFVAPINSGTSINPTLRNLINNGVFWRNLGGTTNVSSQTNLVLAPGAHDGFTNPDVRFIKNVTGATDSITFSQLPASVSFNNDVAPEYYMNYTCTALQAGETTKCVQWPIQLHLSNLNAIPFVVTFWAKNEASNPNNFIDLLLYQFFGSDNVSSSIAINEKRFTLSGNWTKYTFQGVTPSTVGNPVTTTGDDAFYLRLQFPLSQTSNISVTKPCMYIGTVVPGNEFQTYDETTSVFNSPRTGDIKISLNDFEPFGWVAMNDGQIGDADSYPTGAARNNKDTWPLFNYMWNKFFTNQNAAPMLTAGGSPTTYTDPIMDWNNHTSITLTKSLGRAILGVVPTPTSKAFTVAGNVLTIPATTFFTGIPVLVAGGGLPSPLVAGTLYYAIQLSTTTLSLATSYANAIAGTVITLGAGSGTLTTYIDGTSFGEFAHAQSIAEMAAHTHPGSSGSFGYTPVSLQDGGTPAMQDPGATPKAVTVTVASQGGGAAFNIVQPGTFQNIFMKL